MLGLETLEFRLDTQAVPMGSYPTPFLRYLLFYIGDPNHKTRYPKKGVGYDPLGKPQSLPQGLSTSQLPIMAVQGNTIGGRGVARMYDVGLGFRPVFLSGCFFFLSGGGSKQLGFGPFCCPCSKLMRPLPQQIPTTGATHGIVFSIVLIASTKVLWFLMLSSYCYGKP